MNSFDKLPRTIKKTVRYINQDVNSLEKLERIERIMNRYINKKRVELKKEK
ncbi:LytR family transcriptional regulator [Metabacillus niabensis]|uniref:Succinylglutamate desuccinylase n=1 Tax=Metabacillus niabensis TaxID=324854 RepID=A0ABT9Z481_9BACI|nr:LytR family transcriptional regulator [Metabacillus niabensis]MDQ0226800.1 succinylglutamate desuccinylase [Metabacillus niabensis]